MKKAVVLVSGGLDSTTVLAMVKAQGFEAYVLSFAYGQRNAIELEAARRVVANLAAKEHRIANLDLRMFEGSSLTSDLAVPKDRIGHEVPSTYVPARNTIFLSFALAYAEVIGAFDIFYGANVIDFSDYPDCRPEYVQAFEALANKATTAGEHFHIHAPLMKLTKAEIIQVGVKLGVDYSLTHSCYDPVGDLACGHCDSCLFRRCGFKEAGILDPTRYVT